MAKFIYSCTKCGAQASKTACAKGESASLGKWTCPRCGKTKVSRKPLNSV